VRVVALVLNLFGVDEVHAAVARPPGPVPGQARLGVDRTVPLRRDEVEPADVCFGDEHAVAEAGRSEAVKVDVDEQPATALAAPGERADLHHLPRRPARDAAVRPVVGAWHPPALTERPARADPCPR